MRIDFSIFKMMRWLPQKISFALALAFLPSVVWADDVKSVAIPLIKLEYPGDPKNIDMLYIKILKLGSRKVGHPLLFDTGSSGMTIDCNVVLPKKFCSTAGINITKNLEFEGITITTQQVTMHYGTYDEYGNVAWAGVEFGSKKSSAVTRKSIPFLIRYKKVRHETGEIVGGPLWPKGIFGVSPLGGGGSNGELISPLSAVEPASGLRKGYYLSPIGERWKVCTNEQANCPEVPALHLGISDSLKNSFTVKRWQRASQDYNFPTVLSCIQSGTKNVCRPTVYDTGNSTIAVAGELTDGSNSSLAFVDKGYP